MVGMDKIYFYLDCLKPKYLIPNLQLKNISDIDIDFLKQIGIKGLIFDVDNTLAPYHGTGLDQCIEQSFLELTQKFNSCILSNTSSERRKKLEEYFGIHAIQTPIKKPFSGAFEAALDYLETNPSETAMIDDRLWTGIAGANQAGLFTIKVEPLAMMSEPFRHTLVRIFETIVCKAYRK
ncbi:YqeG family HAD IIIA-type phosphatase [Candidatus Woesearchaeota archaeon]|nr:YqeG family HAD IIIA-type phosphatase [Candidatus Woesearchaeota archaeon]